MSPSVATRRAESRRSAARGGGQTQALPATSRETVDLVPLRLAELAIFTDEVVALGYEGNATGGVCLRTAVDHETAVRLYQHGRNLAKQIEAHWEPAKQRLREITAKIKSLMATDLALVQPHVDALEMGITAYRRRIEEDTRAVTRKAAEAEQLRVRAAQEDEAARLETEAKRLRGEDRKDLLADAARVRETPLPSVESTVARAVQQAAAGFTGAGAAPTSTYWSAAIEHVGHLAAHVVASDEALYHLATSIRTQRKNVGSFQWVPADALIGLRREKGELKASPWLNDQASALKTHLNISGVRAVSRDGLRNV